MDRTAERVVRIDVTNKPFGWLITSEDVPGLYLWGRDPEALFADIGPTIASLMWHNESRKVEVVPRESGSRSPYADAMPRVYTIVDRNEAAAAQA